jgi:hypothetical protein
MKIGTVETDRLILRKLIPSDDQGMFLMVSNLNVHHYLEKKQLCLLKKVDNTLKTYKSNTFKMSLVDLH